MRPVNMGSVLEVTRNHNAHNDRFWDRTRYDRDDLSIVHNLNIEINIHLWFYLPIARRVKSLRIHKY